jgi:ribosomal protein L11 methylase PrmA
MRTTWRNYDESIPTEESDAIAGFAAATLGDVRPRMVWDLGCNGGRYADVALRAGADFVVGLDTDPGALDRAVTRAQEERLAFLPLHVDVANPSPSHGWNGVERRGLLERGPADALLALSLVHHVAIGRNVPLPDVVDLLVRIAGEGVIGFVPPDDPRAAALFRGRDRLFDGYTLDNFIAALGRRARILARQVVPGTERLLLRYSTK